MKKALPLLPAVGLLLFAAVGCQLDQQPDPTATPVPGTATPAPTAAPTGTPAALQVTSTAFGAGEFDDHWVIKVKRAPPGQSIADGQ